MTATRHDESAITMQASEVMSPRLVIPPRVRAAASRRRWVILAAVISLGVLTLLLLVRRGSTDPAARYRTALIERRDITQVVEAAGHLDVLVRAEVPAPAAGQLVEILAKTGDQVTREQPLARLDARAAQIGERNAAAVAAAAASRVAEAEAALDAAADTRARSERLRARELASDSELNAARAEERKARAAVQAARAEQRSATQGVKLAQLNQALMTISAPMEGVVLKAPETRGAAVTPEQGALFVLGSSPRTLRVKADVAESDIGQVHPQQTATFGVPAFPGRSFEARVTRTEVEAVRSGLAVRYPVELTVENSEGLLLPGMTASVRIEISRARGVLATREAALRFQPIAADGNLRRSTVWRVADSKLVPVPVKASISDGAYTAIEPESPGALPVGTRVAVGQVSKSQPDVNASGPGIRLGKP
jgi:HlyD family secretion protein